MYLSPWVEALRGSSRGFHAWTHTDKRQRSDHEHIMTHDALSQEHAHMQGIRAQWQRHSNCPALPISRDQKTYPQPQGRGGRGVGKTFARVFLDSSSSVDFPDKRRFPKPFCDERQASRSRQSLGLYFGVCCAPTADSKSGIRPST
jgi:hypothetical protein